MNYLIEINPIKYIRGFYYCENDLQYKMNKKEFIKMIVEGELKDIYENNSVYFDEIHKKKSSKSDDEKKKSRKIMIYKIRVSDITVNLTNYFLKELNKFSPNNSLLGKNYKDAIDIVTKSEVKSKEYLGHIFTDVLKVLGYFWFFSKENHLSFKYLKSFVRSCEESVFNNSSKTCLENKLNFADKHEVVVEFLVDENMELRDNFDVLSFVRILSEKIIKNGESKILASMCFSFLIFLLSACRVSSVANFKFSLMDEKSFTIKIFKTDEIKKIYVDEHDMKLLNDFKKKFMFSDNDFLACDSKIFWMSKDRNGYKNYQFTKIAKNEVLSYIGKYIKNKENQLVYKFFEKCFQVTHLCRQYCNNIWALQGLTSEDIKSKTGQSIQTIEKSYHWPILKKILEFRRQENVNRLLRLNREKSYITYRHLLEE